MLSHLDNALDIAESHKGQGAILQKVSVVTKPKNKLGKNVDFFIFFYKGLIIGQQISNLYILP